MEAESTRSSSAQVEANTADNLNSEAGTIHLPRSPTAIPKENLRVLHTN